MAAYDVQQRVKPIELFYSSERSIIQFSVVTLYKFIDLYKSEK